MTIHRTLFAFVALAAALPAAAQDTERFTVTGDRIEIWNLVGRTTIVPTTGSNVIVEATRAGADRRNLSYRNERGQFSVLYPNRTITYADASRDSRWNYDMRLRIDRDGRFDSDAGAYTVRIRASGSGTDVHADLRILVPKGKQVDVHVGVGVIESADVDGALSLRTRVLPITVLGHRGTLQARTGSGSVRIERADGDLRASTGSGRIELQDVQGAALQASTGSGSVEGRRVDFERATVSTGSGGIRLDLLAVTNLRTSTGSGSTRLAFTRAPRDLTARSGSGSVELTLPENANLEVDVSTGSGGIATEFPVTMESVRRNELRGRIGTGADGFLRASTGSGSVRLLRR